MNRPLCFVLMPFGKKPDAAGGVIDFGAVYQDLIAPAIALADMDPSAGRRRNSRGDHPQAAVRETHPL